MKRPALMKLDPEQLYQQLGRLLESMPDLYDDETVIKPETSLWLGRAAALVEATGEVADAMALKTAVNELRQELLQDAAIDRIRNILHRALAVAEMYAPASTQGAFGLPRLGGPVCF